MRVASRLGLYMAALGAVLAGGIALGAAVGPHDGGTGDDHGHRTEQPSPSTSPQQHDAPEHQ